MTTFCLAMIVSNGEEVLERCLKAVKPLISGFVINYNRKNKNEKWKPENITKTLKKKGMVGWIIHSEWENYGANRSMVFQRIKKENLADYSIVLDADDIIHFDKKKLQHLDKDVYDVLIRSGGVDFYQRRVFSNKKTWGYFGVVHEFPDAIDRVETAGTLEKDVMWIEHKGDGISWKSEKKKYEQHVEEFELLSKPLSPRDQFYYAQSLFSAERMQDAIEAYKARIKMGIGDWAQEVFYSKYMIAKIYHLLNELDKATIYYLDAYQEDPERIEPLYQLCRLLRINSKFALGYMLGKTAIETPMPAIGAKAFIETWAWGPDLWNEFGLCAYYLGKKDEAKEAWTKALEFKDITPAIKESVERNLTFV